MVRCLRPMVGMCDLTIPAHFHATIQQLSPEQPRDRAAVNQAVRSRCAALNEEKVLWRLLHGLFGSVAVLQRITRLSPRAHR
jgi:hypothetical protein